MATPSQGGWKPCPEGELRRLVERLTTRRRLRLAWVASLVTALVVGAGLTAAEVAARMYVRSGIEPLPPCGGCSAVPTLSTPRMAVDQ